ncbi:MAG: hypothetical protein HZB39_13160 [Planctomycetes bacterium]|nr:hypothetical protein [Planctomycetota bacterium]
MRGPRRPRPPIFAVSFLLALSACQVPPAASSLRAAHQPPPSFASAQETPSRETRGAGRKDGDRLAVVHTQYGIPILQRAIFWDGNSEVDNFGVGLSNFWFLSDWFAFRSTLNATWFRNEGNDRIAGEFESGGRFYAHDFSGCSLFFDFTGGYQQVLCGVTFHHFSNALGRENDRNPSQNDARLWIGYGWTW